MRAGVSDAGKAVIIGSATPFASMDAMARELVKAFWDAGQPAELLLMDEIQADPDNFIARLRTWKNSPPRFLTGWNAKLHIKYSGAHVCDVFDIPLLNILVDHPAAHYEHMVRLPAKSVSAVCDRRHLAFLKHAPWPRRAAVFSPHGGPQPNPAPKPHAERALPAVFCGNILAPPDLPALLAAAAKTAPGAAPGAKATEAAETLLHRAEHETADPAELAAAACAELGCETPFEGANFVAFCRLVSETAGAAEIRRRVNVLNAQTAAEVHVFGDIHPESGVRARDNLIVRGPLPFAKLAEVLADARVALNATPKVRDGGHERIFLALSEGCAQITDSNAYLDETLGADKGVCDWPDGGGAADFAAVIDELALDPARSESAAGRDAEAYARCCTWAARAAEMLDAAEAL